MNHKKILIIEDEVAVAQMYKKKLELAGFDVALAYDWMEGLALLNDEVDLILLDIMLPWVNGFEVLKNMKENYFDSLSVKPKVIMFSNIDGWVYDAHGYDLWFDDYLLKSQADPKQLVEKVRYHLGIHDSYLDEVDFSTVLFESPIHNDELLKRYPIVVGKNTTLLRQKCDEVIEITSEIKDFAQVMLSYIWLYKGVWLSAPQLGKTISMIAVTRWKNDRQKKILEEITVMINPHILKQSATTTMGKETCLSLPWIVCDVARPDEIAVSYTTLEGQQKEVYLQWFNARIVSHELDHLEWVLMLDHEYVTE